MTSGEFRRLDIAPVIDLLPTLREEWAGLTFDRDGILLNPLTSRPLNAFSLVSGRHRQVGAIYRITTTQPVIELPDDRRVEFDEEARRLRHNKADQSERSDYWRRRSAASVRVGTKEEHYKIVLRNDDPGSLAFTMSDERDQWTADVEIDHARLPSVKLRGEVDLTAALRAQRTPGCVAGLLGGTAGGHATLDASALELSGRAVDARGRANRFRGAVRVDVRSSATRWTVSGQAEVHAKGVARLVLWVAGRWVRKRIESALEDFWTSSEARMTDLESDIARLRSAIASEGGAVAFVHRWLWDDHFDPGLTARG